MMASRYSSAVLLTILVLGGALAEAAGRPLGSWTDSTSPKNPEDVGDLEEEGMTIPSFLQNYVSSLNPEKIRQYAASLEEHTLGQNSSEFCQDANLICDSDIAVEDPEDADEDYEIFRNTGTLDGEDQFLSFANEDIVQGQDIVFPQSLRASTYTSPSFLPHSLAEKIPFSSEKITELLDTLRISHNSKLATMMSRTVSHCELTKEKSSKETTTSKEKEIKEMEIKGKDSSVKEKTGKETKVEKEKSSKEKEVKQKDIEWNKEESKKGEFIEGKEKKDEGFKEKEFEKKEIEKKELEVKKEKLSKEKEVKQKDVEWNKEESKIGGLINGKEKKDEGSKAKEFEKKEFEKKELEMKKEKSSKEKEVKQKDVEWNKEESKKGEFIEGKEKKDEGIKNKEFEKKEVEKKELEVKIEKSSKEKEVKKEDTEWNKDKKVTAGNELKKKDSKVKEAEVTKEKVVKEKEIEVTKAESSKETLKCVLSLEGMTSFVKKSLPKERKIKALDISSSAKFVKGDHKKVPWKVSEVKKHEKAVVCRKEVFPFAVFKCYIMNKTRGMRLYHVKLKRKDGVYRKEVLACDDIKKSSKWQQCKTGIASQSKASCRWIRDSLVWVPGV